MDELLDIGVQPPIQDAHLLTYTHTSKRFVGFMVGLTVLLVFSSGYLIEIFKENNPFAIRPTEGALESQEVYGELIQSDIKVWMELELESVLLIQASTQVTKTSLELIL